MRYKGFMVRSLLINFISFIFFTSCHYYKIDTITQNHGIKSTLSSNTNRYVVLHSKDSVWHLSNAAISESMISGNLTRIDSQHKKYLEFKNRSKDHGHYSQKKHWKYTPYEDDPTNELHLYMIENNNCATGNQVEVPLEKILFIDMVDEDTQRSKKDKVNGGLALAGLGIIVFVIFHFK